MVFDIGEWVLFDALVVIMLNSKGRLHKCGGW
jgi:hypothetical protein